MALRLTIDGVDITAKVKHDEAVAVYNDILNTRTTLHVSEINDIGNTLTLSPGEAVLLEDVQASQTIQSTDGFDLQSSDGHDMQAPDVTALFGGTIDRLSHGMVGNLASTWHRLAFEAVSFDEIAERHIVAEIYEGQFAGVIARDLVADFLAADGVSDDGIQDGPVIPYVLFNYITVAAALNKLSEFTGGAMIWWIDANKVLRFQSRETTTAPFTITDADYHARSFEVGRQRERYRNRQIIRAGRDLTDAQVETFKGDGARRTFNVAFPVGKEPTITLDTGSGPVAQTVGIRGVEDGFQWYWNKDTTEISQDVGGTVLTSAHTLSVTYRGLFAVVVVVQDDAEVSARKAIENTSGKYEHVQDEPNIDSAQVAADTAFAMLQRDGTIPTTAEFVTREKGVRAGQLLSINLSREDLDADFLITEVRASFKFGDTFECAVSATDGGYVGGWVEYFHRLAAKQRAESVREDETLINVRVLSAPVLADVDLVLTAGAPDTKIGSMQIGWGEIAA
jgi:hypothetical protein